MKRILIALALLLVLGLLIGCSAEANGVEETAADDAALTPSVVQPNDQELIGSIVLSVVGEEDCNGKPCYWIEALVVGENPDEDITVRTLLELENNLKGILDVIKRAVIQVNESTALELALPELVNLITGQMGIGSGETVEAGSGYNRVGTITINLVGREEYKGEACHWIEATVIGVTADDDITVRTLVALEDNLDGILDVIKRAEVQVNTDTALELDLPQLVEMITSHMGGSLGGTSAIVEAPASATTAGPAITPGSGTYEEGQVGPRINRTEGTSTDSGEGAYSDSSATSESEEETSENSDAIGHDEVKVTEGGKPISVLSTSVSVVPFSYRVKFYNDFS
jgi:hypothetical protein